MLEQIRILNGDSRLILSKLPSDSVDLVLTDPPYNSGMDYGQEGWQDKLPDKKYWAAMQAVAWECRRVLKRNRWFVFTINPSLMWEWHALLKRLDLEVKWTAVWAKPHQMSGRAAVFNSGQFCPAWEAILCCHKGGKGRPLGNGHARRPDVWIEDRPDIEHPCARPVNMWEDLLGLFSEPGELVLDPFLGSGTTALVAQRTKRRCIGIELNKQFVELAWQRVNASRHQTRLTV